MVVVDVHIIKPPHVKCILGPFFLLNCVNICWNLNLPKNSSGLSASLKFVRSKVEKPLLLTYEKITIYRWITVDDCSEKLGVSRRTVFQYIKDGNFKTSKWKNRRIIDSVSVIGFLLKKRVVELNSVKNNDIRKEIEVEKFSKMGNELFR